MANFFTWIVEQTAPGVFTSRLLPIPPELENQEICSIQGAVDLVQKQGYIALLPNGDISTWYVDSTGTTAISYPLPPEVANTSICAVGGLGLVGYIALDNAGTVYTWTNDPTTDDVITLLTPNELAGKKICTIGGFGSREPFVYFATDINGNLYVWSGSNTTVPPLLPTPGSINGKHICKVAGGIGGVIALDDTGKVYSWSYDDTGNISMVFPEPPQIRNKQICSIGGLGSADGPNKMAYTAVDSKGQLYIFLIKDSQIQILPQPPEVASATLCGTALGQSGDKFTTFIALDTNKNVYIWFFSAPSIIDLPIPPQVAAAQICSISQLPTNAFAAIVCPEVKITCSKDIQIQSNSPVAVNFDPPTISSACYTAECRLDDGTIVTPGSIFPVGTTTVICSAIPKSCCPNSCVRCNPLCYDSVASCSFTVTVTPSSMPPQEPNQVIIANKVFDYVIHSSHHNIVLSIG